MGKYKKFATEIRRKILDADDPYYLGKEMGMAKSTISDLLHRGRSYDLKRGGLRAARKKINQEHMEAIEAWLEETPDLTLRDISSRLLINFGVDVSPQCVGRKVRGMCYSLKQCRNESDHMNKEVNKEKRKEYAVSYYSKIQNGFTPVFEDETNFNIFCKRSFGRSRRGTRAQVRLPATKGPNLHCIGAISSTALLMCETHRGSLKVPDFSNYLSKLVDNILEQGLRKVVIILDNAPVHSQAELQLESKLSSVASDSYDQIEILRLAPYSSCLNPIENYWSKFKSMVKGEMRRRRVEICDDNAREDGESLRGKRLRIMEEIANLTVSQTVSDDFSSYFNHLFFHLPRALNKDDMLLGQ